MRQIAFLTDAHLKDQLPIDHNINPQKNLEKVLADLSERNIDEIVFGGDIGESASLQYFFNAFNPFSLKLIIGNHDNYKEVAKYFNPDKEKSELYYKADDENYSFIFLDSSSGEISTAQLNWLKAELATDKKPIIFIHHPVLEIETAIDKKYPLENREQLKGILMENEKDILLFCGHYHMNDERSFENIKQITTQALSFQVAKHAEEIKINNSQFGYRIIKLETDKIETELVNFSQNK